MLGMWNFTGNVTDKLMDSFDEGRTKPTLNIKMTTLTFSKAILSKMLIRTSYNIFVYDLLEICSVSCNKSLLCVFPYNKTN
jgi:hypothetical protein